MNIIISDGYSPCCPDCFSTDLIYDFHHAELYCHDCGLVVMDHTISTIELNNYSDERQSILDDFLNKESSFDVINYSELIENIKAESKKLKSK